MEESEKMKTNAFGTKQEIANCCLYAASLSARKMEELETCMSTFLSCAYWKKGRWAFNADGVVLPSPSTSVEESMAYFNSNGLDVWYMTTFLDAQVQARFLSLLLATGKLSEEDKKALVLIMKAAQIPDSIYCESSLSQQSGFKRLAEGAL
ncbi:hypothetical protein HID58_063188 [Brassica napus]|uniref:Uncharacterized protein n=1 Tax=Brassica napus TaxID=3708 RepID=A0ABQ8A450_BRANA|nr:hypothetical protein HID58_063188 [Brassica napus]